MDNKRTKRAKRANAKRRRSKNRLFNVILYILAGALVLAGVFIIINDSTFFFDKLFGGSQPPLPTFPPISGEAFNTAVPASPAFSQGIESHNPYITPGISADPSSDPDVSDAPTDGPHGSGGTSSEEPYDPQPDDPVMVCFPQYDISCPVDPVGLNPKGEMATVRHWNRAGWFHMSGTPARGGNIIIAGHNKYRGHLGYFSIIKDKMKPGDQVIIQMRNGESAFYLVDRIETWGYDGIPDYVMQLGGETRLTLITCLGDFSHSIGTSLHRVIAICSPVNAGG